ncbi:B-cell lymphoma 3 protein [Maublancomyces gigas]|uniref:B-cell lymphoma 3 protein n=1 Tax=Discina gigas TaxID=1032678 RepID=A0ABR3GRX5_9PEZI
MSNLLTIPTEILDEIISNLDLVATSYLLLTCRSLSSRIVPAMHLHAAAPKDNMPALHWAAIKGHLPLVQYLLKIFPVDLLNATGDTPLHSAALSCRTLVTEQLLLHGAVVSRTSRRGYTALTDTCRSELRNTDAAEATIRILLSHGANVHGYASYIPLREAILWASSRATRLLLEAGASRNAKSEEGEPLVLTAAREEGSTEILQILLHHGADVNATNKNNNTAVMVAAGSGFLATVKILVDNGAKLNLVDRVGHTLFSYACRCRNEHVIDYLVRCDGLDINGANLGESAPVYLTVSKGYDAALEILLQRGASTDYVDDQGRSIMHIAVSNGRNQIVRALLNHGVGIDTMDKKGVTPLMAAINLEDRSMMTMLLDHQPDRSRDGFAPLILACIRGADTMVDLLLERGTDINMVDERGMTVMAQAKLEGLDYVVEMLASYGGE